MFMVGVSHLEASPEQLAALARAADSVAQTLSEAGALSGFVVLATCNRFEIYGDAETFHGPVGVLMDAIDDAAAPVAVALTESFYTSSGPSLTEHLFRVTAGLESMVVGEAEVVGQVRTALSAAASHLSPALHRLFEDALAFSKAISTSTSLRTVGRTHASVGLNLAAAQLPNWAETKVLLAGTGQYAGTVVADLVRRGCKNISVYSASNNAERFAASHPVTAVERLDQALSGTDLFVAASGQGGAKVHADALANAGVSVVLDLAGGADIEGALTVPTVDLSDIGAAAPPTCREAQAQTEALLEEAVLAHTLREHGREAAPSVTAMRGFLSQIVEAEVARAKAKNPPEVATAIERSLRRVAGALSHHPSVAAAEMARIGRLSDYNRALELLFGIKVER